MLLVVHRQKRGTALTGIKTLSLDAVAGLMGHSSVAITAENYAIWTQKELADKQRDAARKRNLWDNNRSE